jgi:hypothetical protein
MNNYILYTTDEKIIETVNQFIFETYNETPVEFTSIDWGNAEPLANITAVSTNSDIDIRAANISTGVMITKLDGDNYTKQYFKAVEYADYEPSIESVMDAKAKEYDFDNAVDACSYTNSSNLVWRAESIAFTDWRDYIWGTAVEELKIQIANGTEPSIEDFITLIENQLVIPA